LDSRSRK